MSKGWVAIHRKLLENPVYQDREPFTKRGAWVDILLNVNHAEGKILISGKEVVVRPGQSYKSIRTWAMRWRWTESKVRRFFKMLDKLGMAKTAGVLSTTCLTVCKWEDYQPKQPAASQRPPQVPGSEGNGKPDIGDEIFIKLQKRVGLVCAKLLVEGDVGKIVGDEKRPWLLKWLSFQLNRNNEVRTTQRLFEIVSLFTENDIPDLEAAIKKGINGGWKVLVVDRSKKKEGFPDYWKPGIEAKLKLSPEETNQYYRRLLELKWIKGNEGGRVYWHRPERAPRTGETTLQKSLN